MRLWQPPKKSKSWELTDHDRAVCFTKDNETTDDTPSIITGDTYNLYLDTSVLQLGQTYAPQLQMRQVYTQYQKKALCDFTSLDAPHH
jgi:hypothetical protein